MFIHGIYYYYYYYSISSDDEEEDDTEILLAMARAMAASAAVSWDVFSLGITERVPRASSASWRRAFSARFAASRSRRLRFFSSR